MKIKRQTATHIMEHALSVHDSRLLALMDQDEHVTYYADDIKFAETLAADPTLVAIYNQNPQAQEIIDQQFHHVGQRFIEIFQDTEGVFGLRAYYMQGKLMTPELLELSDLISD
jgi:hypothetical protein